MEALDLMDVAVYVWIALVIGFVIACGVAIFVDDNNDYDEYNKE
jgi:hypothetical protein